MRYIVKIKNPNFGWHTRTFDNYDAAMDFRKWLADAGYRTEFLYERVYDLFDAAQEGVLFPEMDCD